jgi:hypothetical protein
MSETPSRRSLPKRIFLVLGGFAVFTIIFVIAIRLAVLGMFQGIAANKATGLSALPMEFTHSVDFAYTDVDKSLDAAWIARSADLRARTSDFDHSVGALHQVVAAHRGYLDDLRTQTRSGYGRSLSANISVPSSEFESALTDLKTLGRVEAIAESGEDSAVRIASASRHLAAAENNLSRLQQLRRERKGGLLDAITLEKEVAQANEAVIEAERQNKALASTVAQAHIRLILTEDYRAPLQANLGGLSLQLRNSLVEGVGSIFSSAAVVLGAFFEFGLPILFWGALLFVPTRLAWRRFRRTPVVLPAAH